MYILIKKFSCVKFLFNMEKSYPQKFDNILTGLRVTF